MKKSLLIEYEKRTKLHKVPSLECVEKILAKNYITFNKKIYKQVKGIPQGMCVSYILSSFYYSCLEMMYVGKYMKEQRTLPDGSPEINCVMRQTDDYLLITNNKSTAMNFIEKLT